MLAFACFFACFFCACFCLLFCLLRQWRFRYVCAKQCPPFVSISRRSPTSPKTALALRLSGQNYSLRIMHYWDSHTIAGAADDTTNPMLACLLLLAFACFELAFSLMHKYKHMKCYRVSSLRLLHLSNFRERWDPNAAGLLGKLSWGAPWKLS